MDEFQSEKEQIEEIKQWWKRNGSFIVTGIIIGVGVLGGWKYWGDYKERRAAAASAQYDDLTKAIAARDRNGAMSLSEKVETEFQTTPYSSQAALAMAKFYIESDEPELAADQLRKVLANSKDNHLKLVTRQRLARVLLALDRTDEALSTISVPNPGSFAARYHEVRGDIYAAMGRQDDARTEYQSALDKFEPGLFDRQMVEMKLSSLGVTYSESSANTTSDTTPAPVVEIEPGA